MLVISSASPGQSSGGRWRTLGPGRVGQLATHLPRPVGRWALRWSAGRRARRNAFEALHILGRPMTRVGLRTARRARVPAILDAGQDEAWSPRTRLGRSAERRYLRQASAVLTASQRDAQGIRERHGELVNPLICRNIPEPPPASPTPADLRGRLRLPRGRLVLIHGNEPTLGDALSMTRALAGCPDVHLIVLGADDWGSTDAMMLESELLCCAGRLHLLRSVPRRRVAAYAREVDIGLCTMSEARMAGLPELMFGYVREGCPVIVPAGSEGEDLVVRFSLGWVADLANPDGLRDVLRAACGPEWEARRKTVSRAREALSWNAEARILIGMYQGLTSAKRPDARPPGGAQRRHDATRALSSGLRLGLRGLGHPAAALHGVRGRRLRSRGDYAGSVGHFEAALRRDPADVVAAEQRAAALKQAGRTDEAIEAYRELLGDHEIGLDRVAINASINLARLGVRREPIQTLARLTEDSANAISMARAAELAAALGDLARARALIRRATELDEQDSSVRSAEVRVLEQAGEPELALSCAKRASEPRVVRRLEGLVRVFDPTWLPALPRAPAEAHPGRVLHLLETSLPHAKSGYSYRTSTVLAAQRQAGLEPVAATRLGFPANRGVQSFGTPELVEGVLHHRFTLSGVRHYTSVPLDEQLQHNAELVAGLAANTLPQIVQAATPHHNALLGLSVGRALDIPVLYEVRGFPEMTWAVRTGGAATSMYQLRRRAETRCMREADAVITLSEVMKTHIVNRGIPAERVWVVPHMVDVDALAPAEPSPDLLRRYGLEDHYVVGYLGTLLDYEGIDVLLRAIAELRTLRPRVACLIVGSGAAEAALTALAAELGVERQVIFAGRIPHNEVNEHVALFDAYVLPRHDHEVCRWVTPLKPYEAMASGRCLLTSDVDALAETVSGGCGATFPAGDVDALATELAALAADPDRRAELGERGRQKILRSHDRAALANIAKAPIQSVLTRGRIPRAGDPAQGNQAAIPSGAESLTPRENRMKRFFGRQPTIDELLLTWPISQDAELPAPPRDATLDKLVAKVECRRPLSVVLSRPTPQHRRRVGGSGSAATASRPALSPSVSALFEPDAPPSLTDSLGSPRACGLPGGDQRQGA